MSRIIDNIKDFYMYITFTYSMARDVKRFLREEKMMNSRMLYRI